jgi:hypothetical protein
MVLEVGQFGKRSRGAVKLMKCDAGKGRGGELVWSCEKWRTRGAKKKGTSYIQLKKTKGRRAGLLCKTLTEGEMEGKRKRWWRRKQLLDDLKGKRMYWILKAGALDRIVWITRFGKGCGSVGRERTQRMTQLINSSNGWCWWGLLIDICMTCRHTGFSRSGSSSHEKWFGTVPPPPPPVPGDKKTLPLLKYDPPLKIRYDTVLCTYSRTRGRHVV